MRQRHRPPAADIANQFVQLYFEHLHAEPSTLHNFYNDDSVFARLSVGEKATKASNIIGITSIQQNIAELGYQNCKVRIDTIDSQSSVGGGLIVVVTGSLLRQDNPVRDFTQTFFLQEDPASNPPRYYVRNDTLR